MEESPESTSGCSPLKTQEQMVFLASQLSTAQRKKQTTLSAVGKYFCVFCTNRVDKGPNRACERGWSFGTVSQLRSECEGPSQGTWDRGTGCGDVANASQVGAASQTRVSQYPSYS